MGSGSGSTVGSDASTAVGKGPSGTFARSPPRICIRLNDFFMPSKMEFKGWVTDYKQCSYQGLTETEVSNFIKDLHQMVLGANQDRTRNMTNQNYGQYVVQQRNQFANDGRVAGHHQRGTQGAAQQATRASNLIQTGDEPEKKSWAKAHALFHKGLKEVNGDESKIHVVYGKNLTSFFVGSAVAAKYTLEGEGLAGEGWTIKPGMCTEFSEALFEAVVYSS